MASNKPTTRSHGKVDSKRLTEKHLAYYKERVNYWLFVFGQVDWDIDIDWCRPEEEGQELAAVRYNGDGKRATITLNRVWAHDPISNAALDKCACHEVMHLFFADLVDFANEHAPKGVDCNRIEHAMIRTLENILFRDK